jgi:signal transduction histidine kinase
MGEAGMDILLGVLSLPLYDETSGKRRRLFGLTAISYFIESLADSLYNLFQNVFGISNPSLLISSLFEIPLLFFLCLQAWLWWELFQEANAKNRPQKASLLTHLPLIISSLFVFGVFLYFGGWKINRLSGEGLYQLADVLIEAANFVLVSLCLGTSANKAISSMAIGFLIIICSNYMIRLPVVALASVRNSPFEFTWMAGQLLILYGLLHLKQNPEKNSIDNWCYGINCLQFQIAVGGFCLGGFAIVLFSIFVEYAAHVAPPSESVLKYLPPLIILLFIITVILSVYFSKKLLKPLKELEAIIKDYSFQGKFEPLLEWHEDYGIREYIDLKKFIKKALLSLYEQHTIERQIVALAASVAHDIASPLALMEMTVHLHREQLPLDLKTQLRKAIQGIRTMAYTLLEKYRSPGSLLTLSNIRHHPTSHSKPNSMPCYLFLPHVMEEIASQKKVEWAARPSEINLTLHMREKTGWVLMVPRDFRRIISNLLNNAYESLQDKRQIDITLTTEQNAYLSLCISDTGCGIAREHVVDMLEGKSLKHPGKGLGLSGAKSYIEALGGTLSLISFLGKGTKLELFIPESPAPSWFPEGILLNKEDLVIVLDEDETIGAFWQDDLKSSKIEMISFKEASTLIDWCLQHPDRANHAVYLFNHELEDPIWTGLALLEKIQAGNRGYLVTSEAEDASIQQYCTQLGVWLLPKFVIQTIPLKINNHL